MTGSDDRSQSGIDRLLMFVVAVVAIVFLVPHVLGLVGVDVRGDTGSQAPPSDHDLTILSARGEAIDGDGSVGVVTLTVAPTHDRAPVNLREGTAILVTEEAYHLAPTGASGEGFDGTYTAVALEAGGETLAEPTDRGELQFDLGTDDLTAATEVDSRLAPGETATVTLVTARGEHLTRELTVPQSVPGGRNSVAL